MFYLKYISLILLLMSLLFYFFGYVPKTIYKKHDLKNRNYFGKQTIDKVVLIIIDSLRPNMVYEKKNIWSNLYNVINKSLTYPTIAELQPPSMSLAKIKCIVTGAVISFIDVVFNMDSEKIKQDNLIDILHHYRQFVINFYGDLTWTKLFPNQFNFKEPTSPFFITDYFQVDSKISKHIPDIILSHRSWDMVIIHYLGLDHIGHIEGPFSKATETKLIEMDNKTGKLINGLLKRQDSNRTLMILTGDHGMSDLGGHGGSSINEITVPLIFVNEKFQKLNITNHERVLQNDIAPSLALLLGVPIPADNIGVIPLKLLSLIDHPLNQSEALFSNYRQLSKIITNMPKFITAEFSKIYFSISEIHRHCLSNYSTNCLMNLSIEHKKLIGLMRKITNILKTQFIQHDFILLEIGHTLVLLSFFISVSLLISNSGIHFSGAGVIFLLSISSILLSFLYKENLQTCVFTASKMSLIILMITLTAHTLSGTKKTIQSIISKNTVTLSSETVIIFCAILILFGSSFSSFIKEENQIWFYVNNTLLFLLLIKELISKKFLNTELMSINSTCFATMVILITDRFLRTLNRVGELWSSLPDLGDWLICKDHWVYLVSSVGICLLVVGVVYWNKEYTLTSLLILVLIASNGVHRYADIRGQKMISNICVWIYYSVFGCQILLHVIMRKLLLTKCTFKISDVIFFLSFIICRHQNLFLWTGVAIKSLFYHKIWLEEIRNYPILLQYIIFNIVGMSTFYHQGNSNSLTTLDVLPAFVGMTSYVPEIIFPVVAIHTFAGNFYWVFIWLEWLSLDQRDKQHNPLLNSKKNKTIEPFVLIVKTEDSKTEINKDSNISIFTNVILSFTLISSFLLLSAFLSSAMSKHHISAWTIYAPKLLYLCFHGGILLIIYILVSFFYFW